MQNIILVGNDANYLITYMRLINLTGVATAHVLCTLEDWNHLPEGDFGRDVFCADIPDTELTKKAIDCVMGSDMIIVASLPTPAQNVLINLAEANGKAVRSIIDFDKDIRTPAHPKDLPTTTNSPFNTAPQRSY